jgi:hypothetical protein
VTIPQASEEYNLGTIVHVLQQMLAFCMEEAILENKADSLYYDWREEELTYHYQVKPIDRDVLDTLHGVEEIWIVTKGMGGES